MLKAISLITVVWQGNAFISPFLLSFEAIPPFKTLIYSYGDFNESKYLMHTLITFTLIFSFIHFYSLLFLLPIASHIFFDKEIN